MATKDVDKFYTQAEVQATIQSLCPPGFSARATDPRTDAWSIVAEDTSTGTGTVIAEVYCTQYTLRPSNSRWWIMCGRFVTEYPQRWTPTFAHSSAIKKRSLSALMKEGRKFIRAESITEKLDSLQRAHIALINGRQQHIALINGRQQPFTRDSDCTAAIHAALSGYVSNDINVNAHLQHVARRHESTLRAELRKAMVAFAYAAIGGKVHAGEPFEKYTNAVKDEYVPRFFHKSYVSASFACERDDMREELKSLYEALSKGYTRTNFNGRPTDITDVLVRFAKALDAGSDAANIDAPSNKED